MTQQARPDTIRERDESNSIAEFKAPAAARSRRDHVGRVLGIVAASAIVFAGQVSPAQAAVTGTAVVQIAPIFAREPSGSGWKGVGSFNFATGTTSIQVGMSCPTGTSIISGAYAFNSVGQSQTVSLSFNGPRIDESPPNYNGYGWHFYFPSGSAAGTSALFDLRCT